MKIQQFISELKRRSVFKVASIYAVIAWLLIQIAATTFPLFEFPDWTSRLLVILCLIGFPVALILSWAFEANPVSDTENNNVGEDDVKTTTKSIWKSKTPIVVTLIGIIGLLVWSGRQQIAKAANLLPESVRSEKVAVAIFNNFTNDPNLDAFGNMASDWITSGLQEMKIKTSSPEMMRKYKDRLGILPDNPEGEISFFEVTDAQFVVTGSYYQKGDSLQITSRLESTKTGETMFEFPAVWGVVSKKEDLITDIREQLKGYWAVKTDNRLLHINPPKYEAYQAILKCLSLGDPSCYQNVLEIDSTFLLARVYLAHSAYLYENDSLYQKTKTYIKKHWDRCTEFEKNIFVFAETSLEGDYKKKLDATNSNYLLDPKDLDMIHHSAYSYLYLNQPANALKRLRLFFDNYDLYKGRLMLNSLGAYYYALNRLGRQKEVIEFELKVEDRFKSDGEYIRALMLDGNLQPIRDRFDSYGPYQYIRYAYMVNVHFPPDSVNIFASHLKDNISYYKDPNTTRDYLLGATMRLNSWDSRALRIMC